MKIPESVIHDLIHALATYAPKYVDERSLDALGSELTAIIKQRAVAGSVGGTIPGLELDTLEAHTWGLYIKINHTLNLPFSDDVLKSIATGIATNVVSIIPEFGGVGVRTIAAPEVAFEWEFAAQLVTNAAVVVVMALIYIKALTELFSKKLALTSENLENAVKKAQEDKDSIIQAFKDAKRWRGLLRTI